MSPILLYNALFVSYAVVFFNSVGALPNPAVVTVVSKASQQSVAALLIHAYQDFSRCSTAAASNTVVASSSASAPASTSTAISPSVHQQMYLFKVKYVKLLDSSTKYFFNMEEYVNELMTGSNLNMTKLATVLTNIDGTSTTTTSYEYACPNVSPNAPIISW